MKPGDRVTMQAEGVEVNGWLVSDDWLMTDDGRFVPYDPPREPSPPGAEPCASCGRILTREEELDSTMRFGSSGLVVTYICEDCKTPY
jgi:hypothetical protein